MQTEVPYRSDTDLLDAIHRSVQTREQAMTYLWHDQNLRNMVFGSLRKLLRDQQRAEEVFDEGLVQFMLSVLQGKFRSESTIRTYIVGICNNLGKKAAFRPFKYLKWEQALPTANIEQLHQGTTDSPEKTLLEQESEDNLAHLFRKLYDRLPAHCEKSLRWFYSEDRSIREIAVTEHIQAQSIKNRLAECRKKLRECIEQDQDAQKVIQDRIWTNWKK